MTKKTVVRKDDNTLKEIGVTSKGGVYSFIPWDNTQREKSDGGVYSVYKKGENYKNRMENYFTSFPLGVYYIFVFGRVSQETETRQNSARVLPGN